MKLTIIALLTFAQFLSTEQVKYISDMFHYHTNKWIGYVNFNQESPGSPVVIDVHLTDLTGIIPGEHGIHVHQYGIVRNCSLAGSHFNPYGKTHGAPWDEERHVGDLGNINITSGTTFSTRIQDSKMTLFSGDQYTNSIAGRLLAIHNGTDDYGKGGFSDSKTTGHSGDRIICGVIGIAPP